jgi:SHS2 domain-containing protein
VTSPASAMSVPFVPRWEHFEHEADVGLRGFGTTMAEALEQIALALTAVVTEPARVQLRERVRIHARAQDPDLLLYDWLNAIVFEMDARSMVFGRFAVEVEDGELRGLAWGEHVDVARHDPAAEPKGATMCALQLAELGPEQWVASCVVDV